MNSTELLIEINKRLKDSGIVTLVQDFARQGTDYWTHVKNNDTELICSCTISITCIAKPDSYSTAVPFMTADIGSFNKGSKICMLSDHTLTGGRLVTEDLDGYVKSK